MILAGVCLRNHTGEVGGEGAVGGQLTETAGLERAAACSSVDGLILARRHVCRPRYLLLNDYHIYIYIYNAVCQQQLHATTPCLSQSERPLGRGVLQT